eukprot:GCRY01000145.1.p1 GENE.GCRY01000145.1~~GCRY01000145.1.p1  ORF type:complete len:730 (+),score=204.65 GCRY01000145.1:73-2262(+)
MATEINTAAYILDNITRYDGDASFLVGPTEATKTLWKQVEGLLAEELKKGVLDVDSHTVSEVDAFGPGYLNKDLEQIVGVQADAPLKRTIKPYGGYRMVEGALENYGYEMDPKIHEIFSKYRKTHNEGVFDVYTPEMRACRSNGVLTGLPDAYGRGRIIGDYRRIALYGVDALIEAKEADKLARGGEMTEAKLRLREEISEQIKALKRLKNMGQSYGIDLSKPSTCAKEAIQATYFGYLAAVKQQDGAAMSMGRCDAFFDIYIEKDLKEGKITESEAQELIDHFVMKLRIIRHLRTTEYNNLFAGDPTWVTMVLGGCSEDGKHMVTKTAYRILQTLYNMGPAPEPNITVLWDPALPKNFKDFSTKVSIQTSSIQYENDLLMRPIYGCDYGIACCVSAMKMGKQMQYFGARCNLPKLMLYAMNEGRDEVSGKQVGPKFEKLADGPLEFESFLAKYDKAMDWMAHVYVNAMNCIHFMHDKYCYESLMMALHDSDVHRFLAFGVAGISVVADSLSAMKYAKVTPIRNEEGMALDFKIEGDFPKFGNDDKRVDDIAVDIVRRFMKKLRSQHSYRDSEHTLSLLTITSNVVYGKKTGNTPDGRKKGEPFAPGANPMHGRDSSGALASLNSVAKLPYDDCMDGISNTFTIVPKSLGRELEAQMTNLASLLDGYFNQNAHHINVNVLNREQLLDAMENPLKYPNLTIRVSGYAVHFARLTHAQQLEVISRTFHESI